MYVYMYLITEYFFNALMYVYMSKEHTGVHYVTVADTYPCLMASGSSKHKINVLTSRNHLLSIIFVTFAGTASFRNCCGATQSTASRIA